MPESPDLSTELPELPAFPSVEDESESEPTWKNPPQTRLFANAGNLTALKTPKPPGGWMDTPAPKRRGRAYSDSVSLAAAPAKDDPNWTALQTPKPPGGWLATPAPRKVEYADQAVETDTEADSSIEGDRGLDTPTSSISKGRGHYFATPAAPGGWVNTPAAHKSILKVRFDPASETREFSVQTDESEVSDSGSPSLSQPDPNSSAASQTPADSEPAPMSPSKRKATGIRVMDAYGNETEDDVAFESIKTPRRQPIRVLDAYGNVAAEESGEETQAAESSGVNKKELVANLRQGLDDLVQEIHEFDHASTLSTSDLARIKELDARSLRSREKRVKLTQQMRAATDTLKTQMNSMNTTGNHAFSTSSQRSIFRLGPFWLIIALFAHIAAAALFYHLHNRSKRDTFLTTYYDPYNPLLHLNPLKTRDLLANATETAPWGLLLDLLRRRDFRLFGEKATNNLFIHLVQLQTFIWERWGDDLPAQVRAAWPPT